MPAHSVFSDLNPGTGLGVEDVAAGTVGEEADRFATAYGGEAVFAYDELVPTHVDNDVSMATERLDEDDGTVGVRPGS